MPDETNNGPVKDPSFWKLLWKNIWKVLKTIFNWIVRYPIVAVIAVIVIVVGIVLITSGVDLNIGKLLKFLFGRPKGDGQTIAAANTVPKGRVDADGNEIPIGTPDENGWTQWEVTKYTPPTNPLRDKSVVHVTDSEGNDIEVALPTGIKDTDVEEIIEVKPKVYVVKTNNESAVSAAELLNRLPKPKED